MRTLVLNKSNLVDDGNNSRFRYSFKNNINIDKGDQIALSNAQIPYSNFNIMGIYNNNQFSYGKFLGTVFNVVFPDGFYTLDEMNYFLQQEMIKNGHYLVNSDGENVYYLKMSTNQQRYRIQLDEFVVPSTLPANWTNPGNFDLATFGGFCISFVFNVGLKFQKLIGFDDGVVGINLTSNTSFLGQNVPSPALVNSYLITVPTMVNQSSININTSSAVYAKTPDVNFGNNIIIEPNFPIFIDINQGSYSYIDVVICSGDDGSQLKLQDPNTLIMLIIKSKDERS